jgi:hypothetical protein
MTTIRALTGFRYTARLAANQPYGLAVNSKGDAFVVDAGNNRIRSRE